MPILKKIVMTDGPKYDILETILKTGYIPIFIDEAEINLDNSYLKNNNFNILDFYEIFKKLQIAKENIYSEELEKSEKQFVVICDNPILNNQFCQSLGIDDGLLNELNIEIRQIYKRYDLILNKENSSSEIIAKIMNSIEMPTPKFKERKKFIVSKVKIEDLEELNAVKADITQTYLYMNPISVNRKLKKITYCGNTLYYYMKKDEISKTEEQISISKKEYDILLDEKCSEGDIHIARWYFKYNNIYFQYDELDYDGDFEKYAILEVLPTHEQTQIVVPEIFTLFHDVTSRSFFNKFNILINDNIKRNFMHVFSITNK